MCIPRRPAPADRPLYARRISVLSALLALLPTVASPAWAPADGAEIVPGSEARLGESHPRGAWTDPQCGNCHKTEELFSHPVGVIPSMAVPPELPLANGEIACITCHDDGYARLHEEARSAHTPLLRGAARGTDFCSQCHNPSGTGRIDMHARMLGVAHLRWPERAAGGDGSPSSRPFDALSEQCLSCHDGSVATDISHNSIPAGAGRMGRPTPEYGSHPVGVDYRDGLRDGAPLRPREMLDKRIRLYDDRVGCGTCHSPFSAYDHQLVMSNLRSRLCLNCHDY